MEGLLYVVTEANGSQYCHYDRDRALKFYKDHDGVRIESKTKELFPKVTLIVDKPNADLRLLRKDDIMAKTSVAQRKSSDKYDKDHTKQLKLKLNKEHDKDILDYLENCDNVQGLIKELIREKISKKYC